MVKSYQAYYESVNDGHWIINLSKAIPHYLHFHKDKKTFSIEISELNKILNKDFKHTKDGDMLSLYNPKTNIKVDYLCVAPERDAEHEITHYIFKPLPSNKIGLDTSLIVWND